MEKNPKEKKEIVDIRPTGSYFDIDSNGFIINPASIEKIQEEYKPVIEDIIDIYKRTYGDSLKNVYIRGSVAKGEAVKGVSDIDTLAFVDLPLEELEKIKIAEHNLEEKYQFIESFEFWADPVEPRTLEDLIILNQSVCVYGKPIDVPKMKPGKEMAIHSKGFHNRIEKFKKFIEKEHSNEEIERACVWYMKGILRVGFEITMERSGRYTRDLYRCYETFSEYYPEKEKQMKEVLNLALNPTGDKKEIEKIMKDMGGWLMNEIPKYY